MTDSRQQGAPEQVFATLPEIPQRQADASVAAGRLVVALVAGIGERADATVIAHRIQEAVRQSGINLGRWPTTVTVGTAAGDPTGTTFDALLAEARDRTHA